jgi:hypothetical protein
MKKYTVLLVIGLLVAAGIFTFYYHMGSSDSTALADFSAAYVNYDKAMSDFSRPLLASNPAEAAATDVLERKAVEALGVLNTKASARISSLTRHDAEVMSTFQEIAGLSAKELEALQAYKKASIDKNAGLAQFAKAFANLTKQRLAAYAHFLELGGQ